MKLDISKRGDVTVLRCEGSLDADNIAAFKKIAYEVLDKGALKLILDASKVDFVDSMGLGVLISLLRKLKQEDGDIKIVSLTPDVKTIFEITRLYRLFDIFDELKDALDAFKDMRKTKK